MASIAHLKTLFHLVPTNQVAHDALLHPDNRRFVSSSRDLRLGLEVGYHVPSIPRGHVITRLGRNADLILRQSSPKDPMSGIHVAFEVNPATELLVLSVRSKRHSSVRFAARQAKNVVETTEKTAQGDMTRQRIIGDGVILYGQDYQISIVSYNFDLIWRIEDIGPLKSLAVQGYRAALRLLQDMRSRDRPTEGDNSEALSWHMTRLDTAKGSLFKDITHLRDEIGKGAYGVVYKAIDQISGHTFAVKVVDLQSYGDPDTARALLHREIKVLEKINHAHIIEYLGHQHFHTLSPEILLPLREGSLTSLIKKPLVLAYNDLCLAVLKQMLSALDYLASENLIHRDLKPDNILYYTLPGGGLHFQLADFGLANHRSLAKTFCGTGYYQAPELWPEASNVFAPQSPKMDVWSLFATMVAIDTKFKEFPPHTSDYGVVLRALKAKAPQSFLEPMGRLHPDRRASAAQMLAQFFGGWGLTTPRSKILPLFEPKAESASQENPSPAVVSEPRAGNGHDKAPQPLREGSHHLVVYPPRGPRRLSERPSPRMPTATAKRAGNSAQPAAQRLQPIRAHRDGVAKRRARSPAVNAEALARRLLE